MNNSHVYIMIALLAIAPSCGGRGKAPALTQETAAIKVTRGTIEKTVLFTGNIVAKDAVDVYPRASGTVSKKLLKEGDPVKKGQGILEVDRDEIGYSFRPMIVDSPIDGFVGSIDVDVGAHVYDLSVLSQKPAAVVVRPGTMRVKLAIPERYLGSILPGTDISMKVDSQGGETFSGKIITSSPVVDEKTRTANVEAEVENSDGRLRHGMFGRIYLVVDRRADALIVPNGAISWEGDRQFVYRIADDRVHRTEVKVGMRNDQHVEITEGIAENDVLAVGGLIDLRDGEKTSIKKITGDYDAPPPSPLPRGERDRVEGVNKP